MALAQVYSSSPSTTRGSGPRSLTYPDFTRVFQALIATKARFVQNSLILLSRPGFPMGTVPWGRPSWAATWKAVMVSGTALAEALCASGLHPWAGEGKRGAVWSRTVLRWPQQQLQRVPGSCLPASSPPCWGWAAREWISPDFNPNDFDLLAEVYYRVAKKAVCEVSSIPSGWIARPFCAVSQAVNSNRSSTSQCCELLTTLSLQTPALVRVYQGATAPSPPPVTQSVPPSRCLCRRILRSLAARRRRSQSFAVASEGRPRPPSARWSQRCFSSWSGCGRCRRERKNVQQDGGSKTNRNHIPMHGHVLALLVTAVNLPAWGLVLLIQRSQSTSKKKLIRICPRFKIWDSRHG